MAVCLCAGVCPVHVHPKKSLVCVCVPCLLCCTSSRCISFHDLTFIPVWKVAFHRWLLSTKLIRCITPQFQFSGEKGTRFATFVGCVMLSLNTSSVVGIRFCCFAFCFLQYLPLAALWLLTLQRTVLTASVCRRVRSQAFASCMGRADVRSAHTR